MDEKPQEKILKSVENLINQDRVLNFSDGVFAFAATLLVLKIDLPTLTQTDLSSGRILQELINLWPQYFANIISFLIIGYYWLTHHAVFGLIKKYDQIIIWLNIIFLIFLSFLPFPVDLFGDFENSQVIIIFYSATLSLVGFILATVWLYASYKNKLIDPHMSRHQITYYSLRFLLAPIIFLLSIPLVFIDPLLTKVSWVFVIIGIFVINNFFHFKRLSAIEKEAV
jgi:uncharacterized membrane protein